MIPSEQIPLISEAPTLEQIRLETDTLRKAWYEYPTSTYPTLVTCFVRHQAANGKGLFAMEPFVCLAEGTNISLNTFLQSCRRPPLVMAGVATDRARQYGLVKTLRVSGLIFRKTFADWLKISWFQIQLDGR